MPFLSALCLRIDPSRGQLIPMRRQSFRPGLPWAGNKRRRGAIFTGWHRAVRAASHHCGSQPRRTSMRGNVLHPGRITALRATSGKHRQVETSDHSGVLRRLRLLSGLVMFAYIAIHLVNHGLGTISLALAESGLRLETAFWRGTVPTVALYGAAAMHFFLALWTLYHRREWRLPAIEILRLASGFSLPLLLLNHAVTTRLGDTVFGIRPSL